MPPPKAPSEPASEPAPSAEPQQADAAGSQALPAAEAQLGQEIPRQCPEGADPCVPPKAFTTKLCQGKYPSLALVMFQKDAPWQHLFIGDEWLEPINAYGGPNTEGWMRFGEEVLLLKPPGEARFGGARVLGPDDVDILRSDGTCSTITKKALAENYPGVTRSAPIVWKYLEEGTQEALLADKRVNEARAKHKKDCKGSSETHPHKKCESAMKTLNKAILGALKAGLTLPDPDKRPAWPITSMPPAAADADAHAARSGAEPAAAH